MLPITTDRHPTRSPALTFIERCRVADRRCLDDELYFICRHGAFFRPEVKGYCENVLGAGVYFGREARKYLSVDGLSLVPVKRWVEEHRAEWLAYKAGIRRIEAALTVSANRTPSD